MDAQRFIAWLASKEGAPYLWGGRGTAGTVDLGIGQVLGGFYATPYEGWDCWGLVSGGLLEAGGPDLRQWWTDRAWAELLPVATPAPGDLVFYAPASPRDEQDVEHVEVVVGLGAPGWRTLGARGGDNTTTSLDVARAQKACVQYRTSHLERSRFAGFRRLQIRSSL